MLKPWKCEGLAKDGRRSASGRHELFENFGEKCAICNMNREEVVETSRSSSRKSITKTTGVTFSALVILGAGSYLFLSPKPCPTGQQQVNGICQVAASTTNPGNLEGPPSPLTSSSATSVAPPPISNSYRTFSEVPHVPGLIVRYGGSTSMAGIRNPAVVAKILQAHPNFQLQYVEPTGGEKPGSGNGIKMLINDEISIALSSRPLKDAEIERAKSRGFSLEAVPVAIDGIALYVSPQVAISGLTLSQLKDIYTGKITNWNQVGGSNLEIKAFSRDPNDGGTPEYFKEHILAGEDFAPSIARSYLRDQTESVQKISATPGAIAYGTAAEVCNQSTVRSLPLINNQDQPISPCDGQQANLTAFTNSTYPITRQLFVIIKRNGRDAEAAGVAYAEMFLSQEGQQLVQEAGLVPIRK